LPGTSFIDLDESAFSKEAPICFWGRTKSVGDMPVTWQLGQVSNGVTKGMQLLNGKSIHVDVHGHTATVRLGDTIAEFSDLQRLTTFVEGIEKTLSMDAPSEVSVMPGVQTLRYPKYFELVIVQKKATGEPESVVPIDDKNALELCHDIRSKIAQNIV